MLNPKISVIMASFLLPYPNSATNRDKKFVRAVNSFKKQSYSNKELIIVSDGCPLTVELYNKFFINDSNIKLIKIPKQELYSGGMRNAALEIADGDIISYLDTDDVLGANHLQLIVDEFDLDKYDFVYYDDLLVLDSTFKKFYHRIVEPRWASIGTSSISHKNMKDMKKLWSTGYGHDWLTMFKLVSMGLKYKKLNKISEYLVCHYGNGGDF
jgi:glycosyltransferase involved in cell wall biosynthesis